MENEVEEESKFCPTDQTRFDSETFYLALFRFFLAGFFRRALAVLDSLSEEAS